MRGVPSNDLPEMLGQVRHLDLICTRFILSKEWRNGGSSWSDSETSDRLHDKVAVFCWHIIALPRGQNCPCAFRTTGVRDETLVQLYVDLPGSLVASPTIISHLNQRIGHGLRTQMLRSRIR